MLIMQYGRVARDGVACVPYIRGAVVSRLREIGGRSKLDSAVYPYGLLRETHRSSVGTGLGPDQLLGFVYRQCASELDNVRCLELTNL